MTTLTNTHNGLRLKQILREKNLNTKQAVELLQLSNNQHLHYYYNKKQIKESTLKKFLKLLEIDEDKFFNITPNNVVNEDAPVYISTHQGRNLQNILNAKGISITALCSQLNITRPTMYMYFKQKELPLSTLLEMAHVLEIPMARIKGIDAQTQSFEKDVYLLLTKMSAEIRMLKNQLDKK